MFGLMLVGLITTAVWVSIDENYETSNHAIAALGNSSERTIVKNLLHGNPVDCDNYDQVFLSVREDVLRAAIADQYIAAWKFKEEGWSQDLAMERRVDAPMKVRIFLLFNGTNLDCEEMQNSDWKEDTMSNIILKYVPPYKITKNQVRSIFHMFDNTDRGLIVFTTITASVVILLAIITEIILRVRKPADIFYVVDNEQGFEQSQEFGEVMKTKQQFDEIILKMRKQALNEYKMKKKTP